MPERKLCPEVVHAIAVERVDTPAKLKLASDGDSFQGVIQEIGKGIVSLMKIARQLSIGVCDAHHGEADGTRELITPGVIEKSDNTQYQHGNAVNGRDGIVERVDELKLADIW